MSWQSFSSPFKLLNHIQIFGWTKHGRTEAHALFPDYYDYDYGYGEYRGGYSDPYYDDYYGYEEDFYGGGGFGGGFGGGGPRGRGGRGGPPSVGDFPFQCINHSKPLGESV